MARPHKNNAPWFKHETNMRNNVKIRALRRQFSMSGYGVWNCLLEYLTDCAFFKVEITDLNIELLSADFNIEPSELKELIDYCLKLHLLELSEDKKYLSSPLLNDYLAELIEKRSKERTKKSTSVFPKENEVIPNENNVFPGENSIIPRENIQRRKEKSREDFNTSTTPARVRAGGNSSGGDEDSSQPDISIYIQRLVGDTDALLKIVRETKYPKEDVIRFIHQLGRKWEFRKPHNDYDDFLRHIIDTLNIKFKKKERPEQIYVENFSTAKTLWTVVQADLILTDSAHVQIYESLEAYEYKEKEKELILLAPTDEIKDAVKNDLIDSIKDCMRKYTPSQFDVKCGTYPESK